jgi:hypothetical protein
MGNNSSLVLNPALPNVNATRVDNLNNIEQITL